MLLIFFLLAGFKMFAVGVGNAVEDELREIASEPVAEHYFYTADFKTINQIGKKLQKKIDLLPALLCPSLTVLWILPLCLELFSGPCHWLFPLAGKLLPQVFRAHSHLSFLTDLHWLPTLKWGPQSPSSLSLLLPVLPGHLSGSFGGLFRAPCLRELPSMS